MPGGTVCSVATCKSNSKKAKEKGENLMFFRFPKDPKIKIQWVRKCARKDKWNPIEKRLCSKHFKSDDYEDEMQARLLNLEAKKLKKDAIPSLFLPSSIEKPVGERGQRMLKKEREANIQKLLQDNNIESPLARVVESQPETMNIHDIPSTSIETDSGIWKRKWEKLQHQNAILRKQLEDFGKKDNDLRAKILKLEEQIKQDQVQFEQKVMVAFKDFLTANQVEIALKKKSKARWNKEELSRAFTLRYLSKRAYIYVRETLHYPLPGLSTLQQWAANINLRSGILEDVLRIMKITGQVKSNMSRVTVLSFDEVKVSSLYEYCQKDDEVIGPHNYMQVIMARGLFDNWKQPIYIGFDKKMTRDLLECVISKLHEINYNVVACVSDCGSGNQGLWKAMDISINNTSAEHPVTKGPIYFFADVPHLLKLLRNWFIDTGFVLPGDKKINKNPVKRLIENTRSEINSCYKLTPMHLNCEKTQRQNVKLAAQLFSNTTATALKQYLPDNETRDSAKEVGEFFQLVNNWFDVMNSYAPSVSIPTKRPYGTNLDLQNETLDEMLMTVSSMRCIGKQSLQVFQKGIIMSITSLKGLFKRMKEMYDIKYVLTHRLNQDLLENFFSQLRTRGGLHDHPSPLNAIYRVRMILLGKNPGMVQTHANVETSPDLEGDHYVLAAALKQARLGELNIAESEPEKSMDDAIETGSSTSSSSPNSHFSEKGQSERDGLFYIAGYLAKKHREKYPHLGQYTYQTNEATTSHNYSIPSWIQNLSFGGLIQPSEEWSQQVEKMDRYFQKVHKDKFSDPKEIVKKTTAYIERKMTDIPKELVKAFCRQRVFVRIKYLNVTSEERKILKRKAPTDSKTKVLKKMKKIIN